MLRLLTYAAEIGVVGHRNACAGCHFYESPLAVKGELRLLRGFPVFYPSISVNWPSPSGFFENAKAARSGCGRGTVPVEAGPTQVARELTFASEVPGAVS